MATNIRFATEADIPVILEFIHALAAYENMEDQVIVLRLAFMQENVV